MPLKRRKDPRQRPSHKRASAVPSQENDNISRPRRSARIAHQTKDRRSDSVQERSKTAIKRLGRSQTKSGSVFYETNRAGLGSNRRKTRKTQHSTASCSQDSNAEDKSHRTNAAQLELKPSSSKVFSEVLSEDEEEHNFFEILGYVKPRRKSMTRFQVDNDTTITPSISTIRDVNVKKTKAYMIGPADPRYDASLKQHNIAIKRESDPIIDELKKLIFLDDSDQSDIILTMTKEREEIEEANWQADKDNCAKSNEAMIQRTLMMEMLSRHTLDKRMKFVCEASWHSRRFPCKDCSAELCAITQPTPDLAVAFQSDSLLMNDEFSTAWTRLRSLQGHIFPEGTQQYQDDRAFHFFSMEVKGGTLDNKMSQDQNLNTASQALYNIYRCMKEANELNLFFDKVRVFSAVATAEGFWLRVHRAVKVHERQCNNQDYPIGFTFDEVLQMRDEYSKKRVSTILRNVLCRYGVETLHPIMKRIVKILLDRASVRGAQLSQENLSSVPIDSSNLGHLNITTASQATIKADFKGEKRLTR